MQSLRYASAVGTSAWNSEQQDMKIFKPASQT